jgi:hypothetical protein
MKFPSKDEMVPAGSTARNQNWWASASISTSEGRNGMFIWPMWNIGIDKAVGTESTMTMILPGMRQKFAPDGDRNYILTCAGTRISISSRRLANFCTIIHLSKQSLVSQSYAFDWSCWSLSFRIRLNFICQPYHDFLFHPSESEENRVKSELLDCDSDVLTMDYCSRWKSDALRDHVISPNQMWFRQSRINIQWFEEDDGFLNEFVREIWIVWWCAWHWINIAFGWISDREGGQKVRVMTFSRSNRNRFLFFVV